VSYITFAKTLGSFQFPEASYAKQTILTAEPKSLQSFDLSCWHDSIKAFLFEGVAVLLPDQSINQRKNKIDQQDRLNS